VNIGLLAAICLPGAAVPEDNNYPPYSYVLHYGCYGDLWRRSHSMDAMDVDLVLNYRPRASRNTDYGSRNARGSTLASQIFLASSHSSGNER
jgi:hypothetical protein